MLPEVRPRQQWSLMADEELACASAASAAETLPNTYHPFPDTNCASVRTRSSWCGGDGGSVVSAAPLRKQRRHEPTQSNCCGDRSRGKTKAPESLTATTLTLMGGASTPLCDWEHAAVTLYRQVCERRGQQRQHQSCKGGTGDTTLSDDTLLFRLFTDARAQPPRIMAEATAASLSSEPQRLHSPPPMLLQFLLQTRVLTGPAAAWEETAAAAQMTAAWFTRHSAPSAVYHGTASEAHRLPVSLFPTICVALARGGRLTAANASEWLCETHTQLVHAADTTYKPPTLNWCIPAATWSHGHTVVDGTFALQALGGTWQTLSISLLMHLVARAMGAMGLGTSVSSASGSGGAAAQADELLALAFLVKRHSDWAGAAHNASGISSEAVDLSITTAVFPSLQAAETHQQWCTFITAATHHVDILRKHSLATAILLDYLLC